MALFSKRKKPEPEIANQQIAQLFERLWSKPPTSNTVNKLEAYHNSPLLEDCHRVSDDLAADAFNFKVYNKADYEKNEHKAIPIKHPIIDLLKRPCKSEINIDSFSYYKFFPIYYELCGEWPSIVMNQGNLPYELFVVPPNWILSFPSSQFPYYRVSSTTGTGKTRYIMVNPDDMEILKNCTTWNPYDRGRGDVEILADEIDLEDFMIKYAKSFFFNNATPEIIVSSQFRSPGDADAAKQSWIDRLAGRAKAPAFINGAQTQVIPLGFNQREQEFVKSRIALFDQGRQHFAVPPELKGQIEHSNRATIEAAEHIYSKFTRLPKLQKLERFVNERLVRRYPDGDKIIVVYDNIVPRDKLYDRETAIQGWNTNLVTLNEARGLMGLELDESGIGDKRLRDFNPAPVVVTPKVPEATATEEMGKLISGIVYNKSYSESIKKAFWTEITTKAEKQEAAFRNAVKGIGNKQEKEFRAVLSKKLKGKASEEKKLKAVNDALDEYFIKGQNLFVRDSLRIPWIKAMYDGIKTASDLMNVKPEFFLFDESITKCIRTEGLDKAILINGTTKEELRKTIDEIIQAGGSQDDIQRAIQDTYSKMTGETMPASRAENIGRTETIGSANFGALERYKKSGVKQKEWLQEYDDKVRSYEDGDAFDHTDAGIAEKIVDIDEPFEVSGELLMYPGDSSLGASAGNICKCRCTLLPVIEV